MPPRGAPPPLDRPWRTSNSSRPVLPVSPQSRGGPRTGQSAVQWRDARLPAQPGVAAGRAARLPAPRYGRRRGGRGNAGQGVPREA
eukprot:6902191-Alexandrium_andersonii.AAC.1